MSTQLLTPMAKSTTTSVSQGGGGRTFKKQILPVTKINYKGQEINFDRQFLSDVVSSWKDGAFDQVPLQLADAKNTHTNDPERTRGQLVDLELSSDGLYGTFELSEKGAEVIKDNPGLGVSASIVLDYERSDGKHYPRAIQHVLGTLDPRVPGMKPWESVDLAAEAVTETIDLSAEVYSGGKEETTMPEGTEEKVTVQLSQQEHAALLELLSDHATAAQLANEADEAESDEDTAPVEDPDEDDESDEDESDEDESDEDESDEDSDSVENEYDEIAGEKESEPEPVGLAGDTTAAVELANASADTANAQVLELTRELRNARTEGEVNRLRATGLAPSIIEAARPLLSADPQRIDLANGETTDSGQVVRKVLQQVLELARSGHDMIDLEVESGVLLANDSVTEERHALLADWAAEYGD